MKPDCKGQKLGHNFPFTGADCLVCGINQNVLSGKVSKEPDMGSFLDGYIERLKSRRATTKAKNYMQETAEAYLAFINWDNKTFEPDMRAFWITATGYYKSHTHAEFVRMLEWVKSKNCLHPRQVCKLFSKK